MSPSITRKLPLLCCAALAALALLAATYAPSFAQDTDDNATPAAALAQSDLRVNEIMAANNKTLTDPDEPGEAPDWFELYNPGPEDVTLDGLGLADGEPIETGFAIADGITVPAGGYVIFYADNDENQGQFHTDFALSADGESVILYRVADKAIIDRIDLPGDGAGSILWAPARWQQQCGIPARCFAGPDQFDQPA